MQDKELIRLLALSIEKLIDTDDGPIVDDGFDNPWVIEAQDALKIAHQRLNTVETKQWRKVKDRYIRQLWETDCACYPHGHMITVRPTEVDGDPICPLCGDDMVYVETQIRSKEVPT